MAQVYWHDLPPSGVLTPPMSPGNIGSEPQSPLSPSAAEFMTGPTSPTMANSNFSPNPTKSKKGKRFLDSLQRISSSPSLAKLGRSVGSPGYTPSGKASMSCVSLVPSSTSRPTHSYGYSYSSTQSAASYSTAATSVITTPGLDCHDETEFVTARIVPIDKKSGASSAKDIGKTVAVPAGLRSRSKSLLNEVQTNTDLLDQVDSQAVKKHEPFKLWDVMPYELSMMVLEHLKPKELAKCSLVSRRWHAMCFDGQLWSNINTEEYYREITADALARLVTRAGPFVRDLNLRGCVQMPEKWGTDGQDISHACRNLESFSLEGCRIDRSSVHHFLIRNPRLVQVNLSGLKDVSNSAMRILAQGCPLLEHLNVSWCQNVDTRGLLRIVQACNLLKDLRMGEIKGLDDKAFLLEVFQHNTLERLILSHCTDLDDQGLAYLLQGEDPEIDPLTSRAVVADRRLRHLDLSRCTGLTSTGVKCLAGHVPLLTGFQLSSCENISDDALTGLVATTPYLTHLELEELDDLSNATLHALAKSPCAPRLQHLNISYCEQLGDTGMLAVVKACPALRSLVLDNTRVSNLLLVEAAAQVRQRDLERIAANEVHASNTTYELNLPSEDTSPTSVRKTEPAPPPPPPPPPTMTTKSTSCTHPLAKPVPRLHIVVYDCQNVTWTGIREILSRNTEPLPSCLFPAPPPSPAFFSPPPYDHASKSIITLKCFYGYQDTVSEHTKRVLRGDNSSASRLERKWAEYMIATEEAGVNGAGARRRRRRLREAAMVHADEEERGGGGLFGAAAAVAGVGGLFGGGGGGGGGPNPTFTAAGGGGEAGGPARVTMSPGVGRRRARSGGCAVM